MFLSSSPAAAWLNYKGEEHCLELVMENGTEVGDVSADGGGGLKVNGNPS